MLNSIQLFLFASLPFIPIADSVPKFDIARECRSEGGSQAVLEKCAEVEAAARDQVQPLWIQSSAADKATCAGETSADGTPSYVELLTCLEMARDVKKIVQVRKLRIAAVLADQYQAFWRHAT